MSIAASSYAYAVRLGGGRVVAKMVLITLADYADETGRIVNVMTPEQLANICECELEEAMEALDWLLANNFLAADGESLIIVGVAQ